MVSTRETMAFKTSKLYYKIHGFYLELSRLAFYDWNEPNYWFVLIQMVIRQQ